MKKLALITILLAGLGIPFGTSGALFQDQDGKIVFYSDRDGNAEIYVMNTDGSDPQRLTFSETDESSPAWSPDGSQIVFLSARNDPAPHTCAPDCNEDIYVMDADGTNERQLTSDPAPEYHPDWSPDGQYILFDADRDNDGQDEIWRMRANGSSQQVLINSGFNDHWADWSYDGSRIVFVSERDGKQEIYTAAADGSDPQRLTDNDLNEYFPAWAPDGSRIAFMSLSRRRKELHILEQTAGGAWQIIDLGVAGEDPVWSPDGTQIVYQNSIDGDYEILMVNVGGSASHPLTQNRAGDFWPDWWAEPRALLVQ